MYIYAMSLFYGIALTPKQFITFILKDERVMSEVLDYLHDESKVDYAYEEFKHYDEARVMDDLNGKYVEESEYSCQDDLYDALVVGIKGDYGEGEQPRRMHLSIPPSLSTFDIRKKTVNVPGDGTSGRYLIGKEVVVYSITANGQVMREGNGLLPDLEEVRLQLDAMRNAHSLDVTAAAFY